MQTNRKDRGQPEGGAKSSGAGTSMPNGKFSLISDEKLIGLYTNLLKCRATDRQSNGTSNGKHGSLRRREAALVGTAIDLGGGDLVCSLDRGLLTGLFDGKAIEKLMVDSGHNGQAGRSTGKNSAMMDGFPGTSFAHAAIGTALANKTAKNGKIAVVYCGATDSDNLREAVHIASVHALPIVFVQHSDGDSRRPVAMTKRTRRKTDSAEQTPWLPAITVDANDVVAVYRVANEAISRARLGRGPTLIDCQPFLRNGKSEKRNGRDAADPVQNMEHYLRAKGLFDPKLQREIMAETHAL